MPSKIRPANHSRSAGTAQPGVILHVDAPASFDLGLAVSSYGFFMLPPNQWAKAGAPAKAGFRRPLRLLSEESVAVMITQGECGPRAVLDIAVETPSELSNADEDFLREQVTRMLRLRPSDIDQVEAFQSMHEEAQQGNFGYMFRSPSLWEDMVKSITLCNCGWGRTISMNAALCKEIGSGAFPTPRQVLDAGPETLQSKCGVGYRGKTICGLAQQVLDGAVSALEVEAGSLSAADLYKRVLPLSGMGPFTAANVLQLLGHFERIAADSETLRHLKQFHKPPGLTAKNLQEIAQKVYERYHPYQYLAYWYEMRRTYEDLFGCLTEMDPQDYARATGHIMRNCPAGVVRPLGSLAARSDQAVSPQTGATPLSATAATSNAPLLASSPRDGTSSRAHEEIQNSDSATAARNSEEYLWQRQQPAAQRPTRTRKATRAVIDAGLQTLAETRADVVGSGEAGSGGSLGTNEQAMARDAVQHKLEGSAAQPAVRRQHRKRSLQAGKSPGQMADIPQKGRHSAAGQVISSGDDDPGAATPAAPATPEYPLRTRQETSRHKKPRALTVFP